MRYLGAPIEPGSSEIPPTFLPVVAWIAVAVTRDCWEAGMGNDVAVFFDIGDTLASPVIENGRLARLDVYPFVTQVLTRLRASGDDRGSVALGLISNTGNATAEMMDDLLETCGLRSLVDPPLCLYSSVEGLDKTQPGLFDRARSRAGLGAASCVYVGEDAAERAVAVSVGFRVSPQPLHALHLVESEFAPPTTLSTNHTSALEQ